MNSFSIAYKNFKSNIRAYGLYLAAMVFSVLVYYNFMALKHNPDVLKLQYMSKKVAASANSTAVVLLLFLIFFIWYSSSFFLNQRKQEIGIYTFMGIAKYRIAAIFAIENLFIGLTSIFLGLFFGILFSKLFMMALAKVALLNITIDFFISTRGLVETGLTFMLIFILTSIKGYFDIARSKLIDLFNAMKKEEQMPRINYFKGFSSILIIGTGYYISTLSTVMSFEVTALVTISLVIWGTYWFFSSFSTIIAKYLTSRKKILYGGTNIISISNLVFRIRKNYRTFATIAILVATTITSFGTVSSIKYYIDQNYELEVPYTFSYISDSEALNKKILETINNSNKELLIWQNVRFLYKDNLNTGDNLYNDFVIVKYSDFRKITENLKPRKYESILDASSLKEGEALYIPKPGVIITLRDADKNADVEIHGDKLTIIDHIKTPLLGNGVPRAAIIVNDKDYENLKTGLPEFKFNGIIVNDEEQTKELTKDIIDELPKGTNLFSYYQVHRSSYDIYGIIHFLGSFMSLVYMVATGSIIYFKLLSDAFDDMGKYQMLKKIGMTQSEIIRSVAKQVGISFAMPLILGTLHSILAIRVLSKMLNYNLVFPTILSILLFTGIYGIFFYATTRKYIKIVCED